MSKNHILDMNAEESKRLAEFEQGMLRFRDFVQGELEASWIARLKLCTKCDSCGFWACNIRFEGEKNNPTVVINIEWTHACLMNNNDLIDISPPFSITKRMHGKIDSFQYTVALYGLDMVKEIENVLIDKIVRINFAESLASTRYDWIIRGGGGRRILPVQA